MELKEILGRCKNQEGLRLKKALSLLRYRHDCLNFVLDFYLCLHSCLVPLLRSWKIRKQVFKFSDCSFLRIEIFSQKQHLHDLFSTKGAAYRFLEWFRECIAKPRVLIIVSGLSKYFPSASQTLLSYLFLIAAHRTMCKDADHSAI